MHAIEHQAQQDADDREHARLGFPNSTPLRKLSRAEFEAEFDDYVARLERMDWKAKDDAAIDELIDLEDIRDRTDSDGVIWNTYAPEGLRIGAAS